jgi:hypothetical protein
MASDLAIGERERDTSPFRSCPHYPSLLGCVLWERQNLYS